MSIVKVFLSSFMIIAAITVNAQSDTKSRGLLQQEHILKHFIEPHFKEAGKLEITSTKTMDSLFTAIDKSWTKVALDTLNKYKVNMPLEDFKHIDAYCYLWTLLSISQNLDLPLEFKRHLVQNYMLPAMHKDLITIKQIPNLTSLQLVHGGTLNNTIALGSDSYMDKETILSTYELYTSFIDVLKFAAKNPDTAISNYSKIQINEIERFKYDLNAKFNYYNGNTEASLNDVLTGLSTNGYPRTRVFYMSKLLLKDFITSGKKDNSLKLLDALTIKTTQDNINRDTLLNWYIKVDPLKGKQLFEYSLSKTSSSSFIKTSKSIELPKKWNYLSDLMGSSKKTTIKYYLVDVWYTSCGPCILEIPDLNAFHAKFKDRRDVAFISINTDFVNGKFDQKYVSQRSKELAIKFPVVYDNMKSNIVNKLAVKSFPEKFIVDNTGHIYTKADNSAMTLEAFELFIKEL